MSVLKVLVADDDPDVRQTLADGLREHGVHVIEAGNGLEALLYMKRTRPNVMVLDVTMPRLGGLETVKHIRGFDPAIEVIVMTALTDPAVKRQALAMGAVAVFGKPIDLDEVLRVVTHGAAGGHAPTAPKSAGAGYVLIVDDDPDVAQTLEEFMTDRGFAVRRVPDAASAFRALTERAPDLVLLDIQMPGLSGVEALPAIRALAPDATVIMVTGGADLETAARALAYGAFDIVTKPVAFDYLARSVDTAMSLKQLGT